MADKVKKESKIGKFFKDYKSEFKKIVWPEKNDTLRQSGVVVAAIVVVGVAVFLLDTGFSKLFQWLSTLV
ncbi:MAG: preprotein translocase subunit SecE [Clostridia bacterium]|nr:preprotein translocase subunit SecE [Clostridia bacterium]MBQ7399352.1 preprotein translocase subunit SecE [Clostridia bacterium]